jgi:hypothetical protein
MQCTSDCQKHDHRHQKRDREVERIFEGTDLKLERFRNYGELTNSDLRERFL